MPASPRASGWPGAATAQVVTGARKRRRIWSSGRSSTATASVQRRALSACAGPPSEAYSTRTPTLG
ncbi:Uncharacterised protein [Bordetella pertussis]|nr:Uncharacterised protein [Bordetella pertussis]